MGYLQIENFNIPTAYKFILGLEYPNYFKIWQKTLNTED